MKQQFVTLLTNALNRCLQQGDPLSLERLQELDGTEIAFVLLPLTLKWSLRAEANRIVVNLNSENAADCELRGGVFAFLRAMQHANPSVILQQGDLILHGNVHVAEKWFTFFKQIDMDWEACLSEYVGDFFSVRMLAGLRMVRERNQTKANDFCDDLQHYIKREKNWLPPVDEVRKFLDEVDELSLAEERLAARFARLGK